MTIATLQAQVATDQLNLQKANEALTTANTVYGEAVANGAPQATINQAMAEVTSATTAQQAAQVQLNTDQAALDSAIAAAQAAQQPVPPTPPTIAPENSRPPVMVDPLNNEQIVNYGTPSTNQLTLEATKKVATTGLVNTITSITTSVGLTVINGFATAYNTSTGQPYAQLGQVIPDGNTLPANTLPNSTSDNTQALKVTISQEPKLNGDLETLFPSMGNEIVFDVMPTISETRQILFHCPCSGTM